MVPCRLTGRRKCSLLNTLVIITFITEVKLVVQRDFSAICTEVSFMNFLEDFRSFIKYRLSLTTN